MITPLNFRQNLKMTSLKANVIDLHERSIYAAEIIFNDRILEINKLSVNQDETLPYVLPGFVDAHVHIESSMLIPSEFARLAVVHGTVATISDPHEIANVCGVEGVKFMIQNGKKVPFKFHFGAPSCVPATLFETAGATIDSAAVSNLLSSPDIFYLSEMMNFPGAIMGDDEVLQKIKAAQVLSKPIDGHAPGVRGEELKKYVSRGITTDHECFTLEEALEKIQLGMKIIIREGSAAKNFEALHSLISTHPQMVMLCSDDKHPDELAEGHINRLVTRALAKGHNLFDVLSAACVHPVTHYSMNVGLLKKGHPADFIITRNIKEFIIDATYIDGSKVAENGKTLISGIMGESKPNHFNCERIAVSEVKIPRTTRIYPYPIIEALDGQLITNKLNLQPGTDNNTWTSSVEDDILKIVVVNRYQNAPVAKGFIKSFGLQKGAIASSVAHDSHNIVAVGVDDDSIIRAINLIIDYKGGVSLADEEIEKIVPLPVAGLMSDIDGFEVARAYADIDKAAKKLGTLLRSPYMTLSFMALLVIPHLKLSDKGLFDGDSFTILQ